MDILFNKENKDEKFEKKFVVEGMSFGGQYALACASSKKMQNSGLVGVLTIAAMADVNDKDNIESKWKWLNYIASGSGSGSFFFFVRKWLNYIIFCIVCRLFSFMVKKTTPGSADGLTQFVKDYDGLLEAKKKGALDEEEFLSKKENLTKEFRKYLKERFQFEVEKDFEVFVDLLYKNQIEIFIKTIKAATHQDVFHSMFFSELSVARNGLSVPEQCGFDLSDMPKDFPFGIVAGSEDKICPNQFAKWYENNVNSSQKKTLLLEGYGHYSVLSQLGNIHTWYNEQVLPSKNFEISEASTIGGA